MTEVQASRLPDLQSTDSENLFKFHLILHSANNKLMKFCRVLANKRLHVFKPAICNMQV
jgi:hypothetical protein